MYNPDSNHWLTRAKVKNSIGKSFPEEIRGYAFWSLFFKCFFLVFCVKNYIEEWSSVKIITNKLKNRKKSLINDKKKRIRVVEINKLLNYFCRCDSKQKPLSMSVYIRKMTFS